MKETLNIINSFKKISISDYIEIYKITLDESKSKLQKDLTILSMLSGKSEEFYRNVPLEQTLDLIYKIQWIYSSPMANTQDSYELMNGRKIKFIRNFDDKEFTTGQMIDLIQYKKEETSSEEEKLNNLGNILTCICLPIKKTKKGKEKTEKYLETNQKELALEFMEYMSIEDACGISLFFFLFSGIHLVVGNQFFQEKNRQTLQLLLKNLKQDKTIPMKKIQEMEEKINQIF